MTLLIIEASWLNSQDRRTGTGRTDQAGGTMVAPRPAGGRRERNKQEKLERIVTAARDLFTERGVAEVTTQQIAARADVASGTLFLYARSKSELLLLVQNSTYAE